MGSRIFTLPHLDLNFRSAFDAEYSLPRTHLLHIAAPQNIEVEFRCSPQEDLGPDFERLPDDQANEIRRKIDEEQKKQGLNVNHSVVRHVYVHFAIGAQAIYHQPFKHTDPSDPLNSAEVDGTVAVDLNVVLRDDDAKGFEFTATLQGSANFMVLDPNRRNPDITDANELARGDHSQQGQLQLQLAFFFKSFTVLGTKLSFSLLLQAAGGASYSYDPAGKEAGLTYSLGGGVGPGLDIELNEKLGVGLQCGVGPTGQFDGRFNPTGGTVDFACSGVLKGQFDIGGKPQPKKK